MKLNATTKKLEDINSHMLIIPFFSDDKKLMGKLIDYNKTQKDKLQKLLDWKDIKGKYKEFTMFYNDGIGLNRTLVIGLGKKADFTPDRLRSVIAIAARNCRRINCTKMCIYGYEMLGLGAENYSRCIIEGILLGLYKFKKYIKSDKSSEYSIEELTISLDKEENGPSVKKGFLEGLVIGNATNFARDLVNEPGSILTPSKFCEYAKDVSEKFPIEIEILEREDMEKFGMGGILAVSRGSAEPPKMVIMRYNNDPGGKVIGLVGKGLTYDSGGLGLKSHKGLFRMSCDMAGAAAVLGTLKAAAEMKLGCNILAVMPLSENMPDGKSYKMSDIIETYEGKTVEILHTDAEGRLILADALTYAHRHGADLLIDLATLTGGIVTALGHQTTGIMGTCQDIVANLIIAGNKTGELLWQLPLYPEYKMQIKSDVADLENDGGRAASSITAAIFLKEFTGGLPWAHLDIAGTAVTDEEIMIYLKNPYLPKEGGTGVGVRTLYHFIKDFSLTE